MKSLFGQQRAFVAPPNKEFHDEKTDLFEDLATAMESWTTIASKALTDREANLKWVEAEQPYHEIRNALVAGGVSEETVSKVFSECLRGLCVSFLTALDGGHPLRKRGVSMWLMSTDTDLAKVFTTTSSDTSWTPVVSYRKASCGQKQPLNV
ncbi:hypothetical protein ACGLHS_23560 [Variovorax sp. VaC1]|uniref:hypothetical protein n=1 Tax=Variovorax sp. VaC1 TaxID=3373132 RepID=UPI00374933CE